MNEILMLPTPIEVLVALYNPEHEDSKMSIHYLTIEEIKEKYE